ncbi:MAG TPA: hypothetical protein VFQ57_03590 [Sphingomonas sp.]|nr:hypothetical protein [Sphingomonas sp.]
MIHPAFPATLLALAPILGDATAGDDEPRVLDGVALAQLTIHERIVVRVRRIDDATLRAPVNKPVVRKERKGPRCIAPGDLAGVLISRPGAVDMVMVGGRWLRAKLDGECKSLDFYSGVYLKPGPDGQICADRDVIRARSGAPCGISAFKTLVPKR